MFNIFSKEKPKISQLDLLKIRKADWETLAKWWDKLNSWEWPEELLPEEKPTKPYTRESRRRYLMDAIDKKTGHKYILRKLNVWRGDTEEEFEDFWLGHHEGDVEARKRWEDRIQLKYKSGHHDLHPFRQRR